MRMNVCVMCVWIWVCVCAHVLCVCTMVCVCVCVCVYCVCVLQEVCYQYWPSGGSQRFGEFTVQLLGQEDQTGFVLRNFTITNSKVWLHTSCIAYDTVFSQHHCCTHIHTLCVQSRETLNVSQFHITNWAPDGSCSNIKTVTDVIDEIIKVQIRTGNKPITTNTVSRSGMFCAIATTIERCKTEGVVDVFQVVKALRVHKPGAVCTLVSIITTHLFHFVLTFYSAVAVRSCFRCSSGVYRLV